MAGGFGDGNDIKINVSLDTSQAIAGVEELRSSIEKTLDVSRKQFQELAKYSQQVSAVEVAKIKASAAERVAELKKEKAAIDERTQAESKAQALIEAASRKRADAAKIELEALKRRTQEVVNSQKIQLADQKIRLEDSKRHTAELNKETKAFQEAEATKRAEIQKTVAAIRLQTQELKRQSAGAGAGGAAAAAVGNQGGLKDTLKNLQLISSFGSGKGLSGLLGSIAQLSPLLTGAASAFYLVGGAISVVGRTVTFAKDQINQISQSINDLAEAGFKLEGLRSGFENLQRTVAQDPSVSINKLRDATQGLVSDVELYQKANQAVLLNVPTELFNSAASAAVKLGRAMGIDAAAGLEALSLGLGRQSRLYLDNLGIVVSAEQAYTRFAEANGKVASKLSDGEKRAAFFAEALRKITERANDLADPIDSAGIAFKRLEVAQKNIGQQTTEAFNSSQSLVGAYKDLTFQTTRQASADKEWAVIQGELAAAFVQLKSDLQPVVLLYKELRNALLDLFVATNDAEKLTEALERLAKVRAQESNGQVESAADYQEYTRQYQNATKAVNDSVAQVVKQQTDATKAANSFFETANKYEAALKGVQDQAGPTAQSLRALAEEAKKAGELEIGKASGAESVLKAQRDAIVETIQSLKAAVASENAGGGGFLSMVFGTSSSDELRVALDSLRVFDQAVEQSKAAADVPITIRVDTTELDAAAQRLPNLIAQLKQASLEDAGIFKIGGVNQAEFDKALKAVSDLEQGFRLGKISAADYEKGIQRTAEAAAGLVSQGSLAEVADQIKQLEDVQRSGGTLTGEQEARLKELIQTHIAYSERASASAEATETLGKAFDFAKKQGQKSANELEKSYKKSFKSIEKESERLAKELKRYTQQINRIFDDAIPDDIQKKLVDLFNTGEIGSEKFKASLVALVKQLQASKGDVEALIQEISALNDLKTENPKAPIVVDSKTTKDLQGIKDSLKGIVDLKSLVGQEPTGGFFGFDLGESISIGDESAVAGIIQDQLGSIFTSAVDGFTRADAPAIGQGVGTAVGAAIGAYFGDPQTGAQIGGIVGQFLGAIAAQFGQDNSGTKQRKAIDAYFADLFSGGRLGLVITKEITTAVNEATGEMEKTIQQSFVRIDDLVFEGMTNFAGNVDFGGENFRNYFDTLSSDVQAAFNGIGIAFGALNGIATEQARLIGIALANNIGGSLQNLQVLIQQTGESFADLADAVLTAFRASQLTIEEAYNALKQLENLYGEGIPGAIGAWQEAIDNLNASLQSNNPGQYAIDSLRDIGAEGREANQTFQSVISNLGQTFNFSAQQMTLFFEAFRLAGITSLEQLQKASDAQLLTILENIRRIKEESANAASDLATTPQVEYKPPSIGGGINKAQQEADRAAEERKRAMEDLKKKTNELLLESQRYANILKQVAAGELSALQGGKAIKELRKEIRAAVQEQTRAEERYYAELDKGRKANAKTLEKLSRRYKEATQRLDELTEKAEKAGNATKEMDLSGVIPLIKSMNTLGVVSKQVGIDLNKNVDILVKGFLQGRMTIGELNDQIKKTKDLLGPGIPGAIGAVTDAFQNLINAGEKGGQFSVDAFTDIFAEFREKFQKEGSALRKAEREQLVANVNAAREAFNNAVGPEAVEKARKALETAKKSLEDFYALQPKPDLADLRAELEKTFDRSQVDKFFQALSESGLNSFDDFEKAGANSVVGILGRLKELGFSFGTTSDEIDKVNKELQDAEKKANNGLDPLAQAIELVKQFNQGASTLPPVFDATTVAISSLNTPLAQLATGFDNIIEKLSRLSGNTFENDVVFNVRTVGDEASQSLVKIIYGDGSDTGGDTGSKPGSGSGDNATTRAEIERLKRELARLQKRGQGKSDRAEKLRDRIRKLRAKL